MLQNISRGVSRVLFPFWDGFQMETPSFGRYLKCAATGNVRLDDWTATGDDTARASRILKTLALEVKVDS